MKNLTRVSLVIGDWSGDGHNMTEQIPVYLSHTGDSLTDAYKKGVEICGVDIAALLDDFEESTILSEDLRKLSKFGILAGWGFDTEESLTEDYSLRCEYEMYAEMYLRVAKLSDPDNFHYEFDLETKQQPIGGYGLFNF